jgi:hypothetical protein
MRSSPSDPENGSRKRFQRRGSLGESEFVPETPIMIQELPWFVRKDKKDVLPGQAELVRDYAVSMRIQPKRKNINDRGSSTFHSA